MEDHIAHALRKRAPRGVELEVELLRQRRENPLAEMSTRLTPGKNDAFENGDARVPEDELLAHFSPRAEAAAVGACAVRGVERELTRLQLGKRDAACRAAIPLREQRRMRYAGRPIRLVRDDFGESVRQLQRRLD